MHPRSLSRRRAVALIAAAVLSVGGLAVTALTGPDHSRTGTFADAADLGAQCEEVLVSTLPGVPDACAHVDEAPPGVDVDKRVPTSVLEARTGAAAVAVAAAQDEGIPVAKQLAAVTDRVPCDGDGTSGYRVQAVYVVTADKANRYAAVSDQIKQWAAGVNTVFNLSAAKTGGVRNVRYVTSSNGDGTCSPTILNVTVPAGSFATFNSTITAMQSLGHTSQTRKYLMWVDGVGQCGIAQMYPSTAGPVRTTRTTGVRAQYARIDTACWGAGPLDRGARAVPHHGLGAERRTALDHGRPLLRRVGPDVLRRRRPQDDAADLRVRPGAALRLQRRRLLLHLSARGLLPDLALEHGEHRFLIGGGDGVGGGSQGAPTRLGGTLSVNNPAVPGLPTQVAVNLEVPPGRTTTTAWTSARKDCVFANPAAEQTTLTCDAKTTTATTVTATVTDSTGEKLVRSSALTFSTTARTAQPTLQVNSSGAASYTSCPSGKGVLTARVLDQASGSAVKGLSVAWFRKVGTANPVQVATTTTNVDGVATSAWRSPSRRAPTRPRRRRPRRTRP